MQNLKKVTKKTHVWMVPNAPSTHAFFSSRKMENSFRFFVFTSFITSQDRLFKNINNFLYIKQSRLEKNEKTKKRKTSKM